MINLYNRASPVEKLYNRPAGEEMHPFWWLAPPPSPRWGDFILRYALSEGIALQSFILPPEQGEVRRSRIGGGERSEPISRMIIIPDDIES